MVGSGERKRMERIRCLIKEQVRMKAKRRPAVQLGQMGRIGAILDIGDTGAGAVHARW